VALQSSETLRVGGKPGTVKYRLIRLIGHSLWEQKYCCVLCCVLGVSSCAQSAHSLSVCQYMLEDSLWHSALIIGVTCVVGVSHYDLQLWK
jgi:hypothetical protein